jgi:CheY-like chemotaxis protein
MKELKGNNKTQHIPVYMMSSDDVKPVDSINAGAVSFISKPVTKTSLQLIFNSFELSYQNPKIILLIDNNKTHTTTLETCLNNSQKKCLSAESAKEAYGILKNNSVDCVVLGMNLPDATSYEVLEKIKKQKKHEKLPIIIYTDSNLSLKEEVKLKKYANAIVIKTVNSSKRLFDEITLFLNLIENRETIKEFKKPYIRETALKHKNILIVDDDSRNIFSLTKILEMQQVNVFVATDGKEALSILKEIPSIDLVLMDIMMPEMDGYEAIKKIRKNPIWGALPIIVITAKAMLGDREKCIAVGANDYITKPIDENQLLSLLRIWLYK